MSEAIAERPSNYAAIEQALIVGDLSKLTPAQRLAYYREVCHSLGLNSLTKPLEYITLNGQLRLYARKDCADQLRNLRNVSITITAREYVEDCYIVAAKATLPSGRHDESIGVVALAGLRGELRANAMMKAETKAKRRVTLSVCGLGMLDETEVETIPAGRIEPLEPAPAVDPDPGEAPTRLAEAPAAPKAPTNFKAWFHSLRQAAEQGESALRIRWDQSDSKLKKFLRDNDAAGWMSIKQIAAEVSAEAARREPGEDE